MTSLFARKIKAVSILWVGIAFFALSCQPRPPAPVPVEADPDHALFAASETEYKSGNKDRAFEGYREYLERNPRGLRSWDALSRMAEILEERFEYENALGIYQRIIQEFPDHPALAEVSLEHASILYRLGRYDETKEETLHWLNRFPGNPLSGRAFLLLGKTFGVLAEEGNAFDYFVRAARSYPQEDPVQQDLDSYVAGILQNSDRKALDAMAETALDTRFLPLIYDRMAGLALQAGDLDLVREAAMALIRSTPEQSWVDRGRQILNRIAEEVAVRKGVLGCLLPLSGPFAIYGQEVLNGIQMGIGLFGSSPATRSIELLIEDTQGNPDIAANKVEDLVHRGRVMGIIGPLASRSALAAARKAQELGVPIITLTQRHGITEEGDMVFRNALTPAMEMDRLVSKAVNELGLVRFGILYPDSAYGRSLLNLFWDRVDEAGGYVTAVESYGSELMDFSEEIKKMVGLYYPRPPSVSQKLLQARVAAFDAGVETGPYEDKKDPEPVVEFDAVFIPDSFQKVVLIAPQFPFHHVFNIRFLGTSLWQSPALLDQGADYLQGAIFPTGFSGHIEEAFIDLYRKNFETDPGTLAAIGYDTVRFLDAVMNTDSPRTRKELQQALFRLRDFQGIRGVLSFDDQREATTPPFLLSIRGKNFVPLP